MIPLRTATEYANKLIRGRVAAGRVCRVLALEPEVADPGRSRAVAAAGRRAGGRPHRAAGRAPGSLTAIVSEQPDESAELADRLGMAARPGRRRGHASAASRSPP